MIHPATDILDWKEYFAQRGLWITFFLAVFVQQTIMGLVEDDQNESTIFSAVIVATVFSLMYAIAIGSTSCLSEARKRSSSFLSRPLITSIRFITLRFAWGSFRSVFLLVVLFLVYRFVACVSHDSIPFFPDDWRPFFFIATLGLLLLTKTVLWSMLFTFLFGRLIPAAICATVFTLGMGGLLYFPGHIFSLSGFLDESFYLTNYPVEIIVLFFLNIAVYIKWPERKNVVSDALARGTPTNHLIWKEYRAQRGLWLAIFLMVLALQLFLLYLWGRADSKSVYTIAYLSAVFALVYAVACGTTMFGSEREDRSLIFLQGLPISSMQLVFVRVAFGFFSTVCLLIAQQLGFVLLVASLGRVNSSWDLVSIPLLLFLGLFFLKAILWGIFFSLLIGRVLIAVACSSVVIFVNSLSRLLVAKGGVSVYINLNEILFYPYLDLITIVALFLLNVALYRKWSRGELKIQWFQRAEKKQTNVWQKILARQQSRDYNRNTFRSLLWLHGKEVIRICLIAIVVAVAMGVVGKLIEGSFPIGFSFFILPFIPIFMGVCVYRENHLRHTHRFCVEKGISARMFWITKQLVWFKATAFVFLGFFWADTIIENNYFWEWRGIDSWPGSEREFLGMFHLDFTQVLFKNFNDNFWNVTIGMMQYCLFAYCCAMWCSHWFRRTITALVAAVVMTVLFHIWWFYMNWFELSIYWTVYPLVFALFRSSYVSTQNWLLERAKLMQAVRTAGWLVGTVAVVASTLAWYRISSAPMAIENDYYQQFLPRPPTKYDLETGKMYERAALDVVSLYSIEERLESLITEVTQPEKTEIGRKYEVIDGWEYATVAEKQWMKENQSALQLVIEASKRTGCAFQNPYVSKNIPTHSQQWDLHSNLNELQTLLFFSARKLEHEGKLEEAWEYYQIAFRMNRHISGYSSWFYEGRSSQIFSWLQHWMKHPDQKTELLEQAFRIIQKKKLFNIEIGAYAASRLLAIERNYEKHLSFEIHDPVNDFTYDNHDSKFEQSIYLMAIKLMPWEKVRAKRIMDAINKERFFNHIVMDRAIIAENYFPFQSSFSYQRGLYKKYEENDGVPPPPPAPLSLNKSWWKVLLVEPIFDAETEIQNRKNIVLLQLALQIEKRKTGKLPEKLEDLRGQYFEELPIDPWTGKSYRYYPKGLPNDLKYRGGKIVANTPFIFTIGDNNNYWYGDYRIVFIPKTLKENTTGKDYYTLRIEIHEDTKETRYRQAGIETAREMIYTIGN